MGHSSKIKGIPSGTSEVFGKDMEHRLHVIDIIRSIYRKFGFDPLSTPVLEHANVFDGHHGEGEALFFHLKDSKKGKLILRYDLTVPLARYVTDHPDSPIPFKRYQISRVFRDDEVDTGHFREFTQCDGDVIGISDLTADAEVISMAYEGLKKLGFPEFIINVNHRKIINALSEKSGLTSKDGHLQIQRALDAVSKFSEKWEFNEDLSNQNLFLEEVDGILRKRNLSETAIQVLQSVFALTGSFDDKLSELKIFLKGFPEAICGIEELLEIVSYLRPEVKEKINLDLSLARGADYYTGFILEGSIPNLPVGAVLGGGRFDHLVRDLGGPDLPAVGMAFGLERIIVALTELEILHNLESVIRVLVVPQSNEQKAELLDFAYKLRRKGLGVDFIPMPSISYNEIEKYAKKRNFSFLATINTHGVQLRQIENQDNFFDLSLVV